jgi:tetratricopeptide (TPR) repeat protein
MDDLKHLKRWIRERFKPNILIAASFEAKGVLLKNDLTPAEFIEPFCTITQSFTFKSVNSIVNFNRFYLNPVEEFTPSYPDNVLETHAPQVNWHGEYVTDRQGTDQYLRQDRTPWYQAWKARFIRQSSFCSHELIDMPLAFIYIASTSDVDPLNTFQIISRSQAMSEHYTRSIYSADVPKIFMLLHDSSSSTMTNAEVLELTNQARRAFSPHYCVWQVINSGEAPTDFWLGRGQLISRNEASQIQMILNEILTREIVPYVQAEIKRLEAIEREKRGFGSKLSRFFGGSRPAFSFSRGQTEHNMRLLADLCFLFYDYDSALKYYREVIKDFKDQRAYKQAAGALEMQAICIAMTSEDFRTIDVLMEEAYRHYALAEDAQLQVRSTLISETMFGSYRQYRKLADKLLRVGNEVRSIAEVHALFYEQAAMCYLKMKPTYFRKYAFYQVLAGEDFAKLSLRRNALQCYFSSIQLYSKTQWRSLELPLNQMLGKISYHLGLALESVHFLLKVVGSDKLFYKDDSSQKKAINELIGTVAHWVNSGKPNDYDPVALMNIQFAVDGKPILPFSLPQVLSHEAFLPCDTRGQSSFDAMTSTWKSLMEKMTKATALRKEVMLLDEPRTTFSLRKLLVGDSIEVKLTCYNPLKIVLVIEQVQLIAVADDDEAADVDVQVLERIDLPQGDRASFTLKVTPRVPGKLTIKAVRWKIFTVFHGRWDLSPVIPFEVLPQVSRVSVAAENLERTLLHGQVSPFTLVLANLGSNDVEAIEISTSHNTFLGFTCKTIDQLPQSQALRLQMWVRGNIIGRHLVKILVVYTSASSKFLEKAEFAIEVKPSIKVVHKFGPSLRCIEENILCLSVYKEFAGKFVVKQLSSMTAHSLRLIQKLAGDRYFFAVKSGEATDLTLEDDLISDEFNVRNSFIVDMLKESPRVAKERPVDLVMLWEGVLEGSVVKGVHFLTNLAFSVNAVDKLPLHTTFEAPNELSHDFAKSSLCTVPISIQIKNLQSQPIDFKVEACDNDSPVSEAETPLPPHFFWKGVKQSKVAGLESNVSTMQASVTMQLSACFLEPGTYNLSRFKFTVYRNGVPSIYSSELSHYIQVS